MVSDFICPLVYVGLVFALAGYLLRVWHKNGPPDTLANAESSRRDPGP